MRSHWRLLGLAALGAALLACPAATPIRAAVAPKSDPAAELAARIDHHIAATLKAKKATPAPRASDAEFVRRVYLDLAGRIPRVSEVRAFLDDRNPDRRARLIDKLLASPQYVNYLTATWRSLLVPAGNNQQAQALGFQLDFWVREKVRTNQPYDQMVRELLTTQLTTAGPGGRPVFNPGANRGPATFFQVNEMKADNLAAATSRLFLGVKLECAQCHDHPFAKWTRRQFWEYAAFFGGIQPARQETGRFTPATDNVTVRSITIPGTEKSIPAKFLDGKNPTWGDKINARATLAEWVTSKDNPFFARAAVNRTWEHLFGIGLVDPVDDFHDDNPPSHPALLDEMARAFVANGFDLKFLLRAVALSDAYQRTSERTDDSQEDIRLFARMPLKGLTAEQLFDSLVVATGFREANPGAGRRFVGFGVGTPRGEFIARFANPVDRRTEPQTSILQALALMNGRFIADATSLERSEVLAAVIDSPFLSNRQKLDTLFLAAVSRPMRPSEVSRLEPYVTEGGPTREPRRALADVFWVLLNSSEFLFNH